MRTFIEETGRSFVFTCATSGCTNKVATAKRIGRPVEPSNPKSEIAWTYTTREQAEISGPIHCTDCGFDLYVRKA